MGNRKAQFLQTIHDSLAEMRRKGRNPVIEVPPHSNNPHRMICVDTWRLPATVSEFRRNDFINDLEPEKLDTLTQLIGEFTRLTAPYAKCNSVPKDVAKEIDNILERIGETVGQ